jgi:hypothetical protein
MPITPEQAHLSLPTGLSAEDYTLGGGSLLDYTPPNVQWQAPLSPRGESIFGNYVKAHPDILKDYNRRLARPEGSTGALPFDTSGRPQSMESYGLGDWNEFGRDAGRSLYEPLGLWGDPGRSPYIGYGVGTAGGIGQDPFSNVQGQLPQPSVAGYDYAYPIYSYYESPHTGESSYQPGRKNFENRMYLTQDIEKYPYFPSLPQDLAGGTRYEDEDYILVGQTLVPKGDRDDIFSY